MIYRPTRVHKEDPEYYTTSFPPMKYAIDRLRDVSGCTPHLHNPELTFRNGTAGNRTRCVPLASAKTILFKHLISLFIPLLRSILPPEVYTSGWYIYIYIYIFGVEMLMTCTPPQKKTHTKPGGGAYAALVRRCHSYSQAGCSVNFTYCLSDAGQ